MSIFKIGTEFIRGVSGGERKRCSIGMELITSPTLLFLDEPTTGLDSNTANSIIALLHRYKLILITLHHPVYYIPHVVPALPACLVTTWNLYVHIILSYHFNCLLSLFWSFRLSRGGRTIIFSIHQPRYSIFRLFDHLTLLHKGETVYAGPAGKAMDYFQSLGKIYKYIWYGGDMNMNERRTLYLSDLIQLTKISLFLDTRKIVFFEITWSSI